MKAILLNFSIFLLLISCAGESKKVKTKISLGSQMAVYISDYPGGLYVLGHNPETRQAFIKKLETNSYEIELDNGVWEFGAIGWDQGTNAFEGEPKCFMSERRKLEGDIDITLDIDTAGCSNDPFGKEPYVQANGAPKELQFISCSGLSDRNINEDTVTDGYNCSDSQGKYQSFKYVFHDIPLSFEADYALVRNNPVESRCINVASGQSYTQNSNIHVPMFQGIPQTIVAYEGTNCGGSKREILFERGIAKDNNDDTATGNTSATESNLSKYGAFLASSSANSLNQIYLDNDLCDDAAKSSAIITKGNGTRFNPYVICSAAQLGTMVASSHYILGTDILDASAYTSLGSFNGSLDGKGYAINNLRTNLFDNLIDGAEIFDLTIANVNATVNSANFGLLANDVTTSSTPIKIENIKLNNINLTNSVTGGPNTCFFGALFGAVTTAANIPVIMEDIKLVNESAGFNVITATGGSCRTGGLIGAIASSVLGDAILINLEVSSTDVSSNNTEFVGGLVGSATYTMITGSNVMASNIRGIKSVGGLVGILQRSFVQISGFHGGSSMECVVDDDAPADAGDGGTGIQCRMFGGIVGQANNDNLIKNVYADFSIADNNDVFSRVGGIAGMTTGGANHIHNAGTHVNFVLDGRKIGGLVGHLQDGSAATLPANSSYYINTSIASGSIQTRTVRPQLFNSERGGLVGNINSSTFGPAIRMSIADIDLEGDSSIGGIAGLSNSEVHEVYYTGSITADVSNYNTGYAIGGLLGLMTANGRIINARADAVITITGDATECSDTGEFCGLIIGNNQNANNVDQNIAALYVNYSSITSINSNSDANPSFDALGGPNQTLVFTSGSPMLTTGGGADGHAAIIDSSNDDGANNYYGQPWINNGEHIPLFLDKWELMGFRVGRYMIGNAFEPFELTNHNDWNQIQDDAFLLQKAYVLTNNLDFNGNDFYPIGSRLNSGQLTCNTSARFTGMILGSPFGFDGSYTIQDPTIDLSNALWNSTNGCTSGVGMILEAGDQNEPLPTTHLGSEEKPLSINGVSINYPSGATVNIGGFVAFANNLQTSVDMNGININVGGSVAAVGGLIGDTRALDKQFIANSILNDVSITASTANNVGGMFGNLYSNFVEVENNTVYPSNIEGSTNVGGFAGRIQLSGTISKIQKNIVHFESAADKIVAGTNGGGFIGFVANGGGLVAKNIVMLTPTTLDGSISTPGAFMADSASAGLQNHVIGISNDSSMATGYHGTPSDFLGLPIFQNYFDLTFDSGSGRFIHEWQ